MAARDESSRSSSSEPRDQRRLTQKQLDAERLARLNAGVPPPPSAHGMRTRHGRGGAAALPGTAAASTVATADAYWATQPGAADAWGLLELDLGVDPTRGAHAVCLFWGLPRAQEAQALAVLGNALHARYGQASSDSDDDDDASSSSSESASGSANSASGESSDVSRGPRPRERRAALARLAGDGPRRLLVPFARPPCRVVAFGRTWDVPAALLLHHSEQQLTELVALASDLLLQRRRPRPLLPLAALSTQDVLAGGESSSSSSSSSDSDSDSTPGPATSAARAQVALERHVLQYLVRRVRAAVATLPPTWVQGPPPEGIFLAPAAAADSGQEQ